RQHTAVAGLGALAQLDLDHLDLRILCGGGEFLRRKTSLRRAAAEIAGADLPDDIAALFGMIGRQSALAGVMGEAAGLGAAVERANRIGAQRSETHRGNIEDGSRIGL